MEHKLFITELVFLCPRYRSAKIVQKFNEKFPGMTISPPLFNKDDDQFLLNEFRAKGYLSIVFFFYKLSKKLK